MLLKPKYLSRDYLDFPSYPQSFDIAVSPDLSLRNSKAQGKGDRNRREKYVITLVLGLF